MSGKTVLNLNPKCISYFVYIVLFIIPVQVSSWDLAVSTDSELGLMSIDGIMEPVPSPSTAHQFSDLYALTLDPVEQTMFFSVNHHNISIYSLSLTTFKMEPLVPKNKFEVQGLAYDVITTELFWTDGNGRTIWKKSLTDARSEPQRLLELNDDRPMGIVVDPCKRYIFWANSNHRNASIDRANLDGSDHIRIVSSDLFQPIGITIDESTNKLYWTDDRNGIYFRIERSNLDGTERELVIEKTHQEPFSITVINDIIYWTDTISHKLWSLDKWTNGKAYPTSFYDFGRSVPYGIVQNQKEINCRRIIPTRTTTISTPTTITVQKQNDKCVNGGTYFGGKCLCTLQYEGKNCEVDKCYNYCLNGGHCEVSLSGFAECHCLPGFDSTRCEVNVCNGYCLNGGRCRIDNNEPICGCHSGYNGTRCEVEPGDTEVIYNKTESLAQTSLQTVNINVVIYIVVGGLVLICLGQFIGLIVVVKRLRQRRKRPTIKRIIAKKNHMTSRPVNTGQCAVAIENCCDMTICETPCFEPALRTDRSSKKTEDLRGLLKEMEEEPGD